MYGHIRRTVDIAVDNRRLHTARTVRLHPSVLRKSITGQLLSEVLHHVITLKLSVYQHVDIQLLLRADSAFGFFGDSFVVLFLGDDTFLQVRSPLTHVFCLWEGTDGSSRKRR